MPQTEVILVFTLWDLAASCLTHALHIRCIILQRYTTEQCNSA